MSTDTAGIATVPASHGSTNNNERIGQEYTNRAAHVHMSSGSVWSYGTWPHYLYSFESVTTTAAAALTISSVQAYKRAIVVISGLTGETVTITGTNGSGNSQALLQADGSTATTALGNGTYYLYPFVCTDLVFTKSAAVENVTIDVDLKAV